MFTVGDHIMILHKDHKWHDGYVLDFGTNTVLIGFEKLKSYDSYDFPMRYAWRKLTRRADVVAFDCIVGGKRYIYTVRGSDDVEVDYVPNEKRSKKRTRRSADDFIEEVIPKKNKRVFEAPPKTIHPKEVFPTKRAAHGFRRQKVIDLVEDTESEDSSFIVDDDYEDDDDTFSSDKSESDDSDSSFIVDEEVTPKKKRAFKAPPPAPRKSQRIHEDILSYDESDSSEESGIIRDDVSEREHDDTESFKAREATLKNALDRLDELKETLTTVHVKETLSDILEQVQADLEREEIKKILKQVNEESIPKVEETKKSMPAPPMPVRPKQKHEVTNFNGLLPYDIAVYPSVWLENPDTYFVNPVDAFKLLGLPVFATFEEVKERFASLLNRLHPDKRIEGIIDPNLIGAILHARYLLNRYYRNKK